MENEKNSLLVPLIICLLIAVGSISINIWLFNGQSDYKSVIEQLEAENRAAQEVIDRHQDTIGRIQGKVEGAIAAAGELEGGIEDGLAGIETAFRILDEVTRAIEELESILSTDGN